MPRYRQQYAVRRSPKAWPVRDALATPLDEFGTPVRRKITRGVTRGGTRARTAQLAREHRAAR